MILVNEPKTSNPLDRECSVCLSPAGEPCTQPTDRGRRTVAWYHLDREFGIQSSEVFPTSD